ncbi:hypothetical protein LCGC14_1376930 [marine sediment metagenome]|uniref:Uncharacterized protein n=1 Tax=marine sediment metagenome TaxID=412755 RepID=A0A0F9MJ69_9ZZZZ
MRTKKKYNSYIKLYGITMTEMRKRYKLPFCRLKKMHDKGILKDILKIRDTIKKENGERACHY